MIKKTPIEAAIERSSNRRYRYEMNQRSMGLVRLTITVPAEDVERFKSLAYMARTDRTDKSSTD